MISEFLYNADKIGAGCHSGCLEEHNGTVYATWYGYKDKEYDNGQICLSQYDKLRRTWTKAKNLFPNLSNSSCGNPVLFSDPSDKSLHIYFVILQRHYWDSAQIYHSVLEDGETQWSPPDMLKLPMGMMVRHRPIIKSPGVILIPAYDEITNRSIIFESQNPYSNWTEVSTIDGDLIQGDLVRYSEKEWQIFLRPAGDSGHFIFRALSPDNGRSFNTVLRTQLACPLTGIAAIKLISGHTLVCHNQTEKFERTPLTLSIVREGEVTFEKLLDVDSGPIEISYPNLLQQADGTIHLIYTYNRKMMKHIIFSQNFMDTYGL
ncbi:MAG: putative neuraminidase [Bacteriovoracaceae bacterium]|jgi:predicted neuraminidase